jgi:hypothetical protein
LRAATDTGRLVRTTRPAVVPGKLRVGVAAGIVTACAGLALLLAPLHAPGASGSALRPQYTAFGWYAYRPLTATPTADELRRAGVAVPQDAVRRRRAEAVAVTLVGLVGLGMSLALGSRSRRA